MQCHGFLCLACATIFLHVPALLLPCSLPVSPQLSEPQWMQEQRGQAFADINAGDAPSQMGSGLHD
jgi:hypothetical protein